MISCTHCIKFYLPSQNKSCWSQWNETKSRQCCNHIYQKLYRNWVCKNSTVVCSPVQNHNWTASNEYSWIFQSLPFLDSRTITCTFTFVHNWSSKSTNSYTSSSSCEALETFFHNFKICCMRCTISKVVWINLKTKNHKLFIGLSAWSWGIKCVVMAIIMLDAFSSEGHVNRWLSTWKYVGKSEKKKASTRRNQERWPHCKTKEGNGMLLQTCIHWSPTTVMII